MSHRATLYRLVSREHVCPFGVEAKSLLERRGFEVDDRPLKSRKEAAAFQEEHDVDSTPQVFIAGERIGGYEDLRRYLGMEPLQQHASYLRFAAMIATSTAVMFAMSYANSFALDHVFWSETRAYMALVMGGAMAIVMLTFMRQMYASARANLLVVVGSIAVAATALYLVRSQRTVEDVSWMKAMIPHHSIAILTSERARITDPRVRELADEIIDSQRREIDEMKALIADLEHRASG